jgi:hypothetical protein
MQAVAFINVRAASRRSTQSMGKWMLAFRQVASMKVSWTKPKGSGRVLSLF